MRKNFFQRLWERLVRSLTNATHHQAGKQVIQYPLDIQLSQTIHGMAVEEQRSPEEIAEDLLLSGLAQQRGWQKLYQRWNSLSPREQDVAALICLNYTTRQIAGHLYLSESTIRTHWRNVMAKFSINSRGELRQMLADWDFSAWE